MPRFLLRLFLLFGDYIPYYLDDNASYLHFLSKKWEHILISRFQPEFCSFSVNLFQRCLIIVNNRYDRLPVFFNRLFLNHYNVAVKNTLINHSFTNNTQGVMALRT